MNRSLTMNSAEVQIVELVCEVPPRVADTAPFAATTLPFPSLVTPLSAPSPSHAPPSPEPIPVSNSNGSRQYRANDEPIHPIPIHPPAPSPSHPPTSMLPDNFIPYANSTEDITLPPPHELVQDLSRPVSPATPTRSPPTRGLSAAPADPSALRTRDYAYTNDHDQFVPSNPSVPFSPQSKTSTRISDYDLVSRPSESRSSHRHGAFERILGAPRALQTVVERATTPSKKRSEDVRPIEGFY